MFPRCFGCPRASACLFDIDGVLTDTAASTPRAWKEMFDDVPRAATGEAAPFDTRATTRHYVDGKPRQDGVRDFLASRGIELPEGTPDDPPEADTVHGVGNRKNELVQRLIARATASTSTRARSRFVTRCARAGPADGGRLVEREHEHDPRVGGHRATSSTRASTACVVEREHLKGKPAPDSFLRGRRAARRRAARTPSSSRTRWPASRPASAGGFGYVVGVDRHGQPDALRDTAPTSSSSDLAELLPE